MARSRQIPLLLYKVRADLRIRLSNYPYFFAHFGELRIVPDGRELMVSADPNRLCGKLGS